MLTLSFQFMKKKSVDPCQIPDWWFGMEKASIQYLNMNNSGYIHVPRVWATVPQMSPGSLHSVLHPQLFHGWQNVNSLHSLPVFGLQSVNINKLITKHFFFHLNWYSYLELTRDVSCTVWHNILHKDPRQRFISVSRTT